MKKDEITTELIKEARECVKFLYENKIIGNDTSREAFKNILKREHTNRSDLEESLRFTLKKQKEIAQIPDIYVYPRTPFFYKKV